MDALTLVADYLRGLQEQGVAQLPVDEAARKILREWMLAAKRGGRVASAAPMAAPAAAPQAAAPEAEEDTTAAARELRAAVQEPAAEPQKTAVAEEEIPFFRPANDGTPAGAWEALEKVLPVWKPLVGLGTLRSTPVFGSGRRDAAIMFVGDCPTYYDEQHHAPFQGEAGGKLDGMLKAMGLSREQVYLTHLVKFRPAQPRQTLNTRPPSAKEIAYSLPVLDFEIGLVRPRVIVALGVMAARGLLQQGELPLSAYQQMRGANFRGIPVVVTHHPSYLLRTSDLAERRRLWEEMLHVMEMVGLPISAKQRGYFLPKERGTI